MRAKIQAKMDLSNRTRLETVIPLETPYTITIEPTNLCNLRCVFCYQHNKSAMKEAGLQMGRLDMDLYKKMIDQIKRFPQKVKKLKFGGFGEPLLHPQLPKMIEYAKEQDVAEKIDLFTNGLLLTKQKSLDLVNAGLDWVNISANGINAEDYQQNCDAAINMEQFLSELSYLYENRKQLFVYVKLGDNGYTDEQKQAFYEMFGDICDEIYIEPIAQNVWVDIDSHSDNDKKDIAGNVIAYRHVCTMIFTSLIVTSSGEVVACCADWKKKYVIGDLRRQTIQDIWNGEPLRRLRIINLLKQRHQHDLCRDCNIPMLFTPDDVDAYADDLLKKFEV